MAEQSQDTMAALQKKIQDVMAGAQDTIERELKQFQANEAQNSEGGFDQANFLQLVTQFNDASSQVNLLNLLVESVGNYVPRTMLLIRKGTAVHGWAGRGFTAEFVAKQLKRVKWPIENYPEINKVIQSGQRLISSFSDLSDISDHISAFDGFVPLKACFFPIQVKNKIAAILYCDSGSSSRLENQDLVEVLTRIAGTELTLVTSKIKKANKSAKPSKEDSGPPAPVPEQAIPEVQEVQEIEPEKEAAPVDEAPQFAELPEAPSGFDDSPQFESEPSQPQPESHQPQFDSDYGLPSLEPQGIETQAVETQPTPTVSFGDDEDDPNIKKARRVARVLVSDLKLYNESVVETGCKNNDLYQRLQDDINRSFKHYQERVSTLLSDHSKNYFKEELIKQLAGGDANKLGALPF